MITWATTVDPQTESRGFSTYFLTDESNPGTGTRTFYETRTSFVNWSRTQSYITRAEGNEDGPYDGENTSNSFVSVLGLVDSTTFKTRLASNGNTSSYEFSYTKRSVINTTTTETTAEYSYSATTLTSSTYSFPTLSTEGEATFTATSFAENSNVTTEVVLTQEMTVATTTAGAESVATPILATLVRAADKEVIWAAATSAAGDISAQVSAAIAVATSTTQTTIMPWAATISAVQSPSTATTAKTLPLISGSIQYTSEQFTFVETTTIEAYSELPNKSKTTNAPSVSLAGAELQFTVAPQSFVTVTGANAGTETIVRTSTGQSEVSRNGSTFDTSQSYTTTISREYAVPWAETSTSSLSFTVIAGWAGSIMATTSNELTTFARQPHGITMRPPQNTFLQRQRCYYEGVVESGSLAAGYSCEEVGFVGGDMFPLVSREALSLLPGTVEYLTTFLDFADPEEGEEGGEFVNVAVGGTLTISGLKATIQRAAQTQTLTFDLSVYGDPVFKAAPHQTSSFTANLGASETVFQTIRQGVYMVNEETFSTTGGATSWTNGEEVQSAAIFPVSVIEAHTESNNGDVITWGVSRNSHISVGNLTE